VGIANKRILVGIGKVPWLEPTIEQPDEAIRGGRRTCEP
jgi:hypothetical protein